MVQQASEVASTEDTSCPPATLDSPLQDMFERSYDGLGEDKKEALHSLLLRHQEAFMGEDGRLGRSNKVFHRINTGTAPPIKQQARRTPIHQRAEVQQQIGLFNHIIAPRRRQSSW